MFLQFLSLIWKEKHGRVNTPLVAENAICLRLFISRVIRVYIGSTLEAVVSIQELMKGIVHREAVVVTLVFAKVLHLKISTHLSDFFDFVPSSANDAAHLTSLHQQLYFLVSRCCRLCT